MELVERTGDGHFTADFFGRRLLELEDGWTTETGAGADSVDGRRGKTSRVVVWRRGGLFETGETVGSQSCSTIGYLDFTSCFFRLLRDDTAVCTKVLYQGRSPLLDFLRLRRSDPGSEVGAG